MADTDDYPLRTVYFYLTPECNLACRHCWIQPKFRNATTANEYLPLHLFRSVIEQALPLGLSGIKLTGGEPLLHPDFKEILEIARQYNLDVTVETNGTLITPEIAESLMRCKNIFVSVSLDGADAETHEWVRGVKGSYEAVLDGIRTLVAAGIRPQVIMSLFRRNANQIEPLVKMVEEMGAGSVKFNIIQPSARGARIYSDGEGLGVREVIEEGEWIQNQLSPLYRIPLHFSLPAAFRSMGSLFSVEGSGCQQCGIRSIIGVLSNGSFALCGIGEVVPEMIFGSADKDPLKDIWYYHPVIREVREGLPHELKGICCNCIMKTVCLGSCLAQNYCNSLDLWAPYWFCQQAEREGLFPPGRLFG